MSSVASPHRKPGFVRRLFKPAPKKYSATQFLNIASGAAIVGILFFTWMSATWRINIDPQEVRCLPQSTFLVRQKAPDVIERGKIYTYRAVGLEPLLPDGSNMGKIVAGVPGDTVRVNVDGIHINGETWGPLNPEVIEKAGLETESLYTEYTIPEGRYLMLGTLPRSYDGRYWGLIDQSQFQGRAYPLW